MNAAVSWQPSAALDTLRLRAALLAQARSFFAVRGIWEVDTPALGRHAVTDQHLHSVQASLPGTAAPLFLHTSPEYAMKRLLAAGSGDIFQITHVYRGEEASPLHNAEFTLIEWYRVGVGLEAMMRETAQLAGVLLDLPTPPSLTTTSYREAFRRILDLDPFTSEESALRECAIAHRLDPQTARGCGRDALLDWLIAAILAPELGQRGLECLHRYPASQAALARLDPDDPRCGLRFELYYRGVELANGFDELADATEQRRRFEGDRAARRAAGLAVPEMDDRLLSALEAGLPACSGVALGFDRLLMLRIGARSITEVLPFALDRA